jgi:hypothetical protein
MFCEIYKLVWYNALPVLAIATVLSFLFLFFFCSGRRAVQVVSCACLSETNDDEGSIASIARRELESLECSNSTTVESLSIRDRTQKTVEIILIMNACHYSTSASSEGQRIEARVPVLCDTFSLTIHSSEPDCTAPGLSCCSILLKVSSDQQGCDPDRRATAFRTGSQSLSAAADFLLVAFPS